MLSVTCLNPLCAEPLGHITEDRKQLVLGAVKVVQKVTINCRFCDTPYTFWPHIPRRSKKRLDIGHKRAYTER
jgi:hypothetical protein